MSLAGSKILITGITGFTGEHLAKRLIEHGAFVSGISKCDKSVNLCDVYQASITDFDRIKHVIEKVKPDYFVHLAGLSFAALENLLPYYDVNVLGTQNILEACKTLNISPKKIVIASSAAIYGDPGQIFVDETCDVAPISHYGCSKIAMEHIVNTYTQDLNIVMTRPFNYTGVGQPEHFLIPKIVKHFRDKADVIELGNIKIVREFGDVRDVVENYVALMQQDQCGVVNLCSGYKNSFEDVINTLSDITGHKITIKINPNFIREKDISFLVGDASKLVSMTGLRYQHTLRDTLEAMI